MSQVKESIVILYMFDIRLLCFSYYYYRLLLFLLVKYILCSCILLHLLCICHYVLVVELKVGDGKKSLVLTLWFVKIDVFDDLALLSTA